MSFFLVYHMYRYLMYQSRYGCFSRASSTCVLLPSLTLISDPTIAVNAEYIIVHFL